MKTIESEKLDFVKSKTPQPTVEVDQDSEDRDGKSIPGVVIDVAADFAKNNPGTRASIYAYSCESINFHEPTWSVFFIVDGSKDLLSALEMAFARRSGFKSRLSDYIEPKQGHCEYHIQDGELWMPYELDTWFAYESDDEDDTGEELVEGWSSDIEEPNAEECTLSNENALSAKTKKSRTQEQAARYRSARSDATVGHIRRRIEEVFGLPEGSVALCGPDKRPLKGNASIATLRKRWED